MQVIQESYFKKGFSNVHLGKEQQLKGKIAGLYVSPKSEG